MSGVYEAISEDRLHQSFPHLTVLQHDLYYFEIDRTLSRIYKIENDQC